MPAFLSHGKESPKIPKSLKSIALLFANSPYQALGTIRDSLKHTEWASVYFTEGLASIVFLDFTLEKAKSLVKIIGHCPLEYWPLKNERLDSREIIFQIPRMARPRHPKDIVFTPVGCPELSVYVEQISSSLVSLWASYGIYFPTELKTLRQIGIFVKHLLGQYSEIESTHKKGLCTLEQQKGKNAILAAVVEISAALSYAVTQGTSGAIPVLSDRSPFPHHSLFGVGGAIRALNKFTRYLESAFAVRDANNVIDDHYNRETGIVPVDITDYKSGPEYKFVHPKRNYRERFDVGSLGVENYVPLITQFSLRHGFMENKFFVTAASEALTAETIAHWTLMTLSHEIMHNRVRAIFQAIFGAEWASQKDNIISEEQFQDFRAWHYGTHAPKATKVVTGLRNAILNFCYGYDVVQNPAKEGSLWDVMEVNLKNTRVLYKRHKNLARELFVHFHDYYFVYARHPKIYVRSLWASWIKVADPYVRPSEYLTRTLATLACGTGLEAAAAFDYAKDQLLDGLASLEAANINSPIFSSLRDLLSGENESMARINFDPCYYLIDQVRLFFASRTIASKIDSISTDPFAGGSPDIDQYTANVYVFGEKGQEISPIRYLLASLYKMLSRDVPLQDPQWLTAWNYMVISS